MDVLKENIIKMIQIEQFFQILETLIFKAASLASKDGKQNELVGRDFIGKKFSLTFFFYFACLSVTIYDHMQPCRPFFS